MICTMAVGVFKQLSKQKELVIDMNKEQPSMSTENFEIEDENIETTSVFGFLTMFYSWVSGLFYWISTIISVYYSICWLVSTFCMSFVAQWILRWIWRKACNWYSGDRYIVKPGIFSEGMNIYKWVDEFETYLEKNKIMNSHKQTQQLLKLLDVSSRKLLRSACDVEEDVEIAKMEYETIKLQLLQLFLTTRINLRDLRLKFYSRLQAKDESIHRYSQELKEMAREAYPITDKKYLDSYIYTQFLYGIRNPRIQNKLKDDYGTSTSLQEVIRVAKLQEQYEDLCRSRDREENKEVKIKKAEIDESKERNVSFEKSTGEVYENDSFKGRINPDSSFGNRDNLRWKYKNKPRESSRDTRGSSVESNRYSSIKDMGNETNRALDSSTSGIRYKRHKERFGKQDQSQFNTQRYSSDNQYAIKPSLICYNCNEYGHISRSCRNRTPTPYKHEKPRSQSVEHKETTIANSSSMATFEHKSERKDEKGRHGGGGM